MEIINDDNKTLRRFKRYFLMRLLQYAVINAFLAFVNWMTSPYYWWVLWVMAGWGIALVLDMINKWYKLEDTL